MSSTNEMASISTYAVLRKKIYQVLLLGQQKIEHEKIRTYWQTGKLINDFVLRNGRAERNKETISRLAEDLDISESSLYETVQFARAFPYFRSCGNMTWSHLRKLATIPDEKRRVQLLKQAETQEWTAEELSFRLTKIKAIEFNGKSAATNQKPLVAPPLGSFYTYRIIRPEVIHSRSNELLLDLGFSITIETDRFSNHSKFKDGDIISSTKNKNDLYSLQKLQDNPTGENTTLGAISKKQEGLLFTYRAFVERVIDGDTLKVEIDLGFNTRLRETIRLRGIDAFEIDTATGKRAKAYVEHELAKEPFVILKSTRDDKYGRYLGDIFYGSNSRDSAVILRETKDLAYLNQKLLNHKFAVRYGANP